MRACIDGHRPTDRGGHRRTSNCSASEPSSQSYTYTCVRDQGWRASRCMLHAPHTPGVMCIRKRGCTGAEAQRRGRGEHSHRTFRVPTSTSCPYASDLITNKTTLLGLAEARARAGRSHCYETQQARGDRCPLWHSPQDRDDRRQVLRHGQRPIGRSRRRRRRRRLRAADVPSAASLRAARVAASPRAAGAGRRTRPSSSSGRSAIAGRPTRRSAACHACRRTQSSAVRSAARAQCLQRRPWRPPL